MTATLLIAVPFAAALVVWVLPFRREWTELVVFVAVAAEIGLWVGQIPRLDWLPFGAFDGATGFNFAATTPQLGTTREWFEDLGISYSVGYYGFQVWLVGLTIAVMAAAIGYGMWAGRERTRAYYGLMLFLFGSLVGMFSAQDLLLFYVFFEAMLIPLYVLVGVWGGAQRVKATITFVLYTMAGSLLMLASVIALGISKGTFSLAEAGTSDNDLVFLGFLVAFAVKAPLFPFHGWVRLAYTESPPEVAAILSGVVSKAAVFGLVWVVLPHFPEPVENWREVVLVLACITIVYGSLLAFRQPDARGVIAYSSMGQMGLIVLGIFAVNDLGLDGAVLHSVSHGLVSASLFLLAAMVAQRTGSDAFSELGGLAKGRPALATLILVTGMFALAVPGSANFAGEFAILAGVFTHGWGYAAVGAGAIVLAAMYVLRFVSAILHEQRGRAVPADADDLGSRELWLVAPLVVLLVALSVWPAAVSERSFPNDSATELVSPEAPQ
jgi:NADH-quinone oxidoreductase subunit M